jgi:hypothetical protein
MIQNLKAKRDEIVAGGVALSAFAASAQHIFHVTAAAGNPDLVAALHPAGIDGLIYIGIRAMQGGNKKAGAFAVAYGAAYSLAFNAASYGGFRMPVWALAACMPLAMFFAFLIVHGGHKLAPVTETVEKIVEVVKEVQVLPQLLPIVPPAPRVQAPAPPAAVAKASTRQAAWDVEKVVAMIVEGKETAEIQAVVDVHTKTLQRTRRVVKLIQAGVSTEDIVSEVKPPISLAGVERIRAAIADMN